MKRRIFLKSVTQTGIGVIIIPDMIFPRFPGIKNKEIGYQKGRTDKYGGYLNIRGKATGWFHIEKFGNRFLFVTPEGNGFFCLGFNHLGKNEKLLIEKQLRDSGFNMAGYNPPAWIADSDLPYDVMINPEPITKHHPVFKFPDVFDPLWQGEAVEKIRSICEQHRERKNLIGYILTDTPTWNLFTTRGLRGTDWVTEIRRMSYNSPGKKHYIEFLNDRYLNRASEFKSAYLCDLNKINESDDNSISNLPLGNPKIMQDDQVFLGIIAGQYYQTFIGAIRKYDPNHLVFGDNYLIGDHPVEVVDAAKGLIDAVSVQPGDSYTPLCPPSDVFPVKELDWLHRQTGKPILISDHQISFPTPDQPLTSWTQLPSEKEAAEATEKFIRESFGKGYILGYQHCQHTDSTAEYRGTKRGLYRQDGTPYKVMLEAHRKANSFVINSLSSFPGRK